MAAGTYLDNVYGQARSLRDLTHAYGSEAGAALLDQAAGLLVGRSVTSTGMGASYFALHATRHALDSGPLRHWIEDTGYLSEHLNTLNRPLEAVLLVSQSGESVEAKALISQLTDVPLIVITGHPGSTIADSADLVLPLFCGDDLSVAVQSYSSSIAVLTLLATRIAGEPIGPVLDAIRRCADLVDQLPGSLVMPLTETTDRLVDAAHLYALGRGSSFGSALGTALLLKEAAKRDCEGSSSAQFRHGAVEVVSASSGVIVFADSASGQTRLDQNLIAELLRYGSRVVVVSDDDYPTLPADVVSIRVPTVSGQLRAITEMIPMQLLAHQLAERNGFTAGEFRNTVPVIVSA